MLPSAYLYLSLTGREPVQVIAFEVLRQPYGIETARLVVPDYTSRFLDQIFPGAPAVLRWGTGSNRHTVYGYIYESRPEIRELQRTVTIVVIGMQHPMAWLNRIRSFPKTGPHNVVAEVVDDYRFITHIAPAPVQEIPDQNNVSDWQYLSDLARSLGYILLCIGSEIVFAPIDGYWRQSFKHQTYAATFRDAMSPSANLKTFERSESPLFTVTDKATGSPFDTDLDFLGLTSTPWIGSKAFDLFAALFPTTAIATLLDPGEIYPLDAFEVTLDVDRMTWAAIQIKYVLRLDDYYAEIALGSNGLLYPSMGEAYDISTALQWRQATTARPPILVVTDQVRTSTLLPAHWEASLVTSPGTKEESWLIGL